MKLRAAIVILASLAATLAVTCGCTDGADQSVFKSGGNSEQKPVADLLKGVDLGADANAEGKTVTQAAMVDYELKITSNSGAQLCDGEAKVQIMSNFSFQIPVANINCVSLSVNLAGLLANGAGAAGVGSTSGNLSDDGQVLSIKNVANADFNPPRPLLLGPIVQDPSKYQNFDKTIQTTLTSTDGSNLSSPGQFEVKVLDLQTTYDNNYISAKGGFNNVLHWQMTASGFNTPAKYGLTFEKMEFYWNTRPIMVPKIQIVGKLSDFIQPAAGSDPSAGDTASEVVGDLTVDLIVKDYDMGSSSGG